MQDQITKLENENKKNEEIMEKKDKQIRDLLTEKKTWDKQKKNANKSPYRNPNSLFAPGNPNRPTIGQSVEISRLKSELEQSESQKTILKNKNEIFKGNILKKNRRLQKLSDRLNQAQAPEKIHFTKSGTCYHKVDCVHLQYSKNAKPKAKLKRCKDC